MPVDAACLQAVGAACGHAAFGKLRELLQGSLEEDVQSNKNTFLNRWVGLECGGVGLAAQQGGLEVGRS